jgi:hypothetical protein
VPPLPRQTPAAAAARHHAQRQQPSLCTPLSPWLPPAISRHLPPSPANSIAISRAISRHLVPRRRARRSERRPCPETARGTERRAPPRRAAPRRTAPHCPLRRAATRCMWYMGWRAMGTVHGVHEVHGRRAQINRGNVFLAVSGAGARCIRRRAELSVAMNPACPSESAAARAVEDAWGHCFKDRAPFPQALENPPGFS